MKVSGMVHVLYKSSEIGQMRFNNEYQSDSILFWENVQLLLCSVTCHDKGIAKLHTGDLPSCIRREALDDDAKDGVDGVDDEEDDEAKDGVEKEMRRMEREKRKVKRNMMETAKLGMVHLKK